MVQIGKLLKKAVPTTSYQNPVRIGGSSATLNFLPVYRYTLRYGRSNSARSMDDATGTTTRRRYIRLRSEIGHAGLGHSNSVHHVLPEYNDSGTTSIDQMGRSGSLEIG
jgi:hypothetical protein